MTLAEVGTDKQVREDGLLLCLLWYTVSGTVVRHPFHLCVWSFADIGLFVQLEIYVGRLGIYLNTASGKGYDSSFWIDVYRDTHDWNGWWTYKKRWVWRKRKGAKGMEDISKRGEWWLI